MENDIILTDKEKLKKFCKAIELSEHFILDDIVSTIEYKNKTKNNDFKESIIF